MRKSLLVSFIGKAGKEEGGYKKTCYKFEDGFTYESSFFTVVMHAYLRKKENVKPDLLIVGTTGSTWSELFGLSESEEVFKVAQDLEKGFSNEKLKQMEKSLSESLGVSVKLLAIKDNPPQVLEICEEVLKVLSEVDYEEIFYAFLRFEHFDDLQKPKNFKIRTFYGFLEYTNKDGTKPAYELTQISQLLDTASALSLLMTTGDFRVYYEQMGKGDLAKEVYYRKLEELLKFHPSESQCYLHKKVNPLLCELRAEYLDESMVNRAKFFADKGQYLKAIVLLYEAFLVLICRKQNRHDCNKYNTREELRNTLRQRDKKFEFLSHLRNTIVHGSQPKGKYSGKIQRILCSEEEFRKVFKEYLDYYRQLKEEVIQ
ncbi:TM1812 family CRISPR-associated protein [Hydrogenobacter hydrogenophilus]|uniref:Apea-like HEPN domain-containing protein n=1 Tax=Hydrogenobacter hydrogenophilus TaxID=35835 RepID=A0A285P544_9AQUI|nr:TM1812 family CRISPR-associated protein [Hydrogenobacter hydrogenophilus]SNZ16835.1 hypothetical protein SAMN06265353_1718 [Hydrogenobacter hydrogenophilus]